MDQDVMSTEDISGIPNVTLVIFWRIVNGFLGRKYTKVARR